MEYHSQKQVKKFDIYFKILSGILICLGIVFFISAIRVVDFSLFQYIDKFLSGLVGSLKVVLPIFMIWIGFICLPQKRFNTYTLAFVLLFVLYLQILSVINLGSTLRLPHSNETLKLMDLIERLMNANPASALSSFQVMYGLTSNNPFYAKMGGAIGNLLAWPLWKNVGFTGGLIILTASLFLTSFIFVYFVILPLVKKTKKLTPAEIQQQQYLEYLQYMQQMQDYYNQMAQQQGQFNQEYDQNMFNSTSAITTNHSVESENKQIYIPEEDPVVIQNAIPLKKKGRTKSSKKNVEPQFEEQDQAFVQKINKQVNKTKKTKTQAVQETFFQRPVEEVVETEYSAPRMENTANSTMQLPKEEYVQPNFVPPTSPTTLFDGKQTGKRLDNLIPTFENKEAKPPQNESVYKGVSYVYPKSTLLEDPAQKDAINTAMDDERAKLLEDTLESFGITTTVANVTHGPAVTRFELDLASGINVKRINNVADNIALNMSAESGVRIEAPIPGTTYVGIEIPNKKISPVSFKEVMYSQEMLSEKDPLAIALGKDITGKSVICNLAQMPHLLIAGATGSGKSVCINAIITSIIFRCSPEECRLILIDPKMVELQRYNVLPHLLIPVVCEPHKASGALAWALAEMTDRYNRFKDCAVSNIQTYNSNLPKGAVKLPRIVVVIDELADLMISASRKEIEHDINRIAALARAAGIHLVVATQRPSVDVITGVIKANLLSRIAFLSSSATDSRTILDRSGAENLVGNGDMLYMPSGYKNPVRVQGCFLKNNEINNVLAYIAQSSTTNFDADACEAIEKSGEEDALPELDENTKVDPLLEEAIDMVLSDGQASISMLQRRMSIGYARAGRLIDAMTKLGVISRSAGSKPREVLISREEYERIKDDLL